MFLQIHTLTSYPASLLNRDDAGLAKRVPFGNAIRLRVSSQCLKRHWRENLQHNVPEVPDSLRTRHFFTRSVLPGLMKRVKEMEKDMKEKGMEEKVMDERRAAALTAELAKAIAKDGANKDGSLKQPLLLGLRERDYFIQMLLDVGQKAKDDASAVKALTEHLKEEKANLEAMSRSAAGLTAALFGRMVTSDLLARVDAPVHVAHAFTVQAADTEMDYFTVVDDLNRDDETGAAHANQSELGTGIYYNYIVVDIPLLISNMTGCLSSDWNKLDANKEDVMATTRKVLTTLIHAITSQTPGAKLGSTAPYARAECVLLETGKQQPRTLANAYLDAIKPQAGSSMQQAIDRMGDYLRRVDGMYGTTADHRALATIHDATSLSPLTPQSLDAAIAASLDAIWG